MMMKPSLWTRIKWAIFGKPFSKWTDDALRNKLDECLWRRDKLWKIPDADANTFGIMMDNIARNIQAELRKRGIYRAV